MSISPVMSPMIASYTPPLKEEDAEYKRIKYMLELLGVESTGDKAKDKVLLQSALSQMMAQQSSSTSKDYVPFKDIMDMLDLESTGSVDKDYDRTIDELDYRITLANDDDEKSYYTELRDQVESLYTENSYDKARTTQFMGSSQVSDMNRYLLGI